MTKRGDKLAGEHGSPPPAVNRRDGPNVVKRLTVALGYKSGPSPAKIESKYGTLEQTVYDWLNQFAERGV